MKAIMVMYDSLNLRKLAPYGCPDIKTPNFDRLAAHAVTFDNCYIGSMPCMPARREIHTGRYNFMHRSWGPIEPYDDSMPELLQKNDIYAHLSTDHQHYWEDGGATYHTRYSTFELNRGQEGDPWKGHVADCPGTHRNKPQSPEMTRAMKQYGILSNMDKNDMINRAQMDTEEKMPQARTFTQGLEFIETNHNEDNWYLQIETFDPHEPFFASERFRALFPDPDDYTGTEYDWPQYEEVKDSPEMVKHCQNQYAALLSMCDYYLGMVLDAMDKYDLWKDTMLIVNTDHGFLLGEHGWWGKSVMPYYNEIAHIPFFIWDPRCQKMGERRESLVQTIDIAPTVLRYFGIEPTKDMLGHDLAETIAEDKPVREYALFGTHGNQMYITDGNYVYMRCPIPGRPLYEYTLMPTHMRFRFKTEELMGWEQSREFSFTKGLKLMKVKSDGAATGASRTGKLNAALYDLKKDPGQMAPYRDYEVEAKLCNEMIALMKENDAPEELYDRFGFDPDSDMTAEIIEEQEDMLNNLTMEGFDGLAFDKPAYLATTTMLSYVPGEAKPMLAGGLRSICDAMETNRVTTEVLKALVQSMPMDEAQKAMFINMVL